MAKSDQPITIKKYANRRLYNTGTSTYVTLEDLASMVKAGEDFVVFDAKTNRYVAGSALAGQVAAADDDARAALLAEVSAGLRPYVDDQGLAFPIESNVAVAQR